MTEVEWLACTNPKLMLEFIGGKATERKLRLLGCGCCHRGWERLPSGPLRQIIMTVESVVEGESDASTLLLLRAETRGVDVLHHHVRTLALQKPTARSTEAVLGGAARLFALHEDAIWENRWQAEAAVQSSLIRCIFGNPFHSLISLPSWLTSTVVSLARCIYDEKTFDYMPILADALVDVGCDNADILDHCRQPGEHVRGCWVLDLLLGKQ